MSESGAVAQTDPSSSTDYGLRLRCRRRPAGDGMEQINGVVVALVASVVIMLAWMYLPVPGALIATLVAAGGVVVAARLKGNQDD